MSLVPDTCCKQALAGFLAASRLGLACEGLRPYIYKHLFFRYQFNSARRQRHTATSFRDILSTVPQNWRKTCSLFFAYLANSINQQSYEDRVSETKD